MIGDFFFWFCQVLWDTYDCDLANPIKSWLTIILTPPSEPANASPLSASLWAEMDIA